MILDLAWVLNTMTGVFKRRGEDMESRIEGHWKWRQRLEFCCHKQWIASGHKKLSVVKVSTSFKEIMALPIPWSGFQNYVRIHFKPPSLWWFVMAALVHEYNAMISLKKDLKYLCIVLNTEHCLPHQDHSGHSLLLWSNETTENNDQIGPLLG